MPDVGTSVRAVLDRDPISDVYVVLMEISEDGRSDVLYLASNTEDVVHNGQTYTRAFVDVTLPGSGSDDVESGITISNVDRDLSRIIDRTNQRINVRLKIVSSADWDTAVLDTQNLLVCGAISGTSEKIVLSLEPRVTLQEPVPFRKTTKQLFPGVWQT